MTGVSIQVVNYKTLELTASLLRQLRADVEDSALTWRIAVLDNGSGDDLAPLASLIPDDRLTLIQHPDNVGFGAGHNLLARTAPADDALLLLNPDCRLVERDTVLRLVAALLDSKASGVAPQLLSPDGRPQMWDHSELHGARARLAAYIGEGVWRPGGPDRNVAWISGAAPCLDGAAFRQIGGFDPQFFLYKEEEDLCRRLRAAGHRVRYVPSIRVEHADESGDVKRTYSQPSTDYFRLKHGLDFHSPRPRLARLMLKLLPYATEDVTPLTARVQVPTSLALGTTDD